MNTELGSRRGSVASAVLAMLAVAMIGCGRAGLDGADAGLAVGDGAVTVEGPLASTIIRQAPAEPTAREALGREIFFDKGLSNPPGTSCASCHDPAEGFAGSNGSDVGVARGSRPGHLSRRNAPSVLYVKYVPAFHFALEDDDDLAPSPFGGFGWGGRADSVAEFARLPLLDPDEMNNANEFAVAAKVRAAPYADALSREFPRALASVAGTMNATSQSLQAFLTSDAMAPFSSKYDDYVRRAVTLSPLEMRGLRLFKNPDKGACDACHRFEDSSNRPDSSLFTNYGYDALAVPRNVRIPANADATYHDLGLCERKDTAAPSSASRWCASFRTPSLRNVAVRQRFMHNGAFSKLRDVVAFYATRSTSPALWYPPGAKFDDVPAKYQGNVNVASLPYNRREGAAPAYDDGDVDAIVAFLETLTDAPYRARLAVTRR